MLHTFVLIGAVGVAAYAAAIRARPHYRFRTVCGFKVLGAVADGFMQAIQKSITVSGVRIDF